MTLTRLHKNKLPITRRKAACPVAVDMCSYRTDQISHKCLEPVLFRIVENFYDMSWCSIGTISCTLSCTNTGTGSINPVPLLVTVMVQDWWYAIHVSYTQDGWPFTYTHLVGQVLCWMDFLHAGQMAMHTHTSNYL